MIYCNMSKVTSARSVGYRKVHLDLAVQPSFPHRSDTTHDTSIAQYAALLLDPSTRLLSSHRMERGQHLYAINADFIRYVVDSFNMPCMTDPSP